MSPNSNAPNPNVPNVAISGQEFKCVICDFTVWSHDPDVERHKRHIGWKKDKDGKWLCPACAADKTTKK